MCVLELELGPTESPTYLHTKMVFRTRSIDALYFTFYRYPW